MSAPPEGWLDAIRAASARVAERAVSVRIEPQALQRLARELPRDAIAEPEPDPVLESLGPDPERRASFAIALDAVNFGSGYFPFLRKLPGHSGYRTIEARLRTAFERPGALRAGELADMDAARCAALFEQPLEPPLDELMERFATAWRELGACVQTDHGGAFLALARTGGDRAEPLVNALAELRSYRDVAEYQGRPVPFLKRAQITAADLASALPQLGYRDLDRLTLFADNLVPHVLRIDGVLRYAPELEARIEREEPIESGSPEEVEIRACGVHAVECLARSTRESGRALAPYQLDRWLWLRGGTKKYKARPRHRTRSWFY